MKKWNGRFNFFAGSQKMTYTERTWQVFVDRVVALWDQGLSVAEIAKKLDTSELIVEKVVEDFNLEDDA